MEVATTGVTILSAVLANMYLRLERAPALKTLRTFCTAAEHLSFKEAADAMHLTPSAVSHQIKELEAALQLRLFERKTRAVTLTLAGRSLVDEIVPLLEAIDAALVRVARRGQRQSLRISLPPFFASEILLPRMASFCQAHPDLDIHLDTHDPRPEVHPPNADLSILLSQAPPSGGRVVRLFPLALMAVCAVEHAETVARLGSRVFDTMALLVHKARPYAWNSWAEELGLAMPDARNVIELDTMPAVVRAAESGVGIALIPDVPCADWFDGNRLVRIFATHLSTPDAYYLAMRHSDARRPEVLALANWITGTFLSAAAPAPASAPTLDDEDALRATA